MHTVDVADPDSVDAVLSGVDAAVLTIRLAPGEEARLAPLTCSVRNAAARHSTHILIVGGSAPLRSPTQPDQLLIDHPNQVPKAWKAIAQASLNQFPTCEEHFHTGWVYLSPPAVPEPGDRTGSYQRGRTMLLTDADGASRITPPDLATAVLDELEQPSDDQHCTAAHGSAS